MLSDDKGNRINPLYRPYYHSNPSHSVKSGSLQSAGFVLKWKLSIFQLFVTTATSYLHINWWPLQLVIISAFVYRHLQWNETINCKAGHRQLSPRLHYAGEIWKRSFISMVRPTVHTNPSRKRSFSKTLFKPGNLKTPAWREIFWKRSQSETMTSR